MDSWWLGLWNALVYFRPRILARRTRKLEEKKKKQQTAAAANEASSSRMTAFGSWLVSKSRLRLMMSSSRRFVAASSRHFNVDGQEVGTAANRRGLEDFENFEVIEDAIPAGSSNDERQVPPVSSSVVQRVIDPAMAVVRSLVRSSSSSAKKAGGVPESKVLDDDDCYFDPSVAIADSNLYEDVAPYDDHPSAEDEVENAATSENTYSVPIGDDSQATNEFGCQAQGMIDDDEAAPVQNYPDDMSDVGRTTMDNDDDGAPTASSPEDDNSDESHFVSYHSFDSASPEIDRLPSTYAPTSSSPSQQQPSLGIPQDESKEGTAYESGTGDPETDT
jgi:hypothetical protein